jgi:hypothetical protein
MKKYLENREIKEYRMIFGKRIRIRRIRELLI